MENKTQKQTWFYRSKEKILREAKSIYGLVLIKDLDLEKFEDEKRLRCERMLNGVNRQMEKVMIRNKLGPGKYAPTSPHIGNSHSFSSLPRFSNTPEEKFRIRRNKSPTGLTPAISRQSSNNRLNKPIMLRSKKSSNHFKIMIAKETKKIIDRDSSNKRIQKLGLKHENTSLHQFKPSYSCKKWANIICFLSTFNIIKKIVESNKKRGSMYLQKRSKSSFA